MKTISFLIALCIPSILMSQSLQSTIYKDPQGYFEFHPPDGWRIEEYQDDVRGKVAFFGPENSEIRVLVSTGNFDNVDSFVEEAKAIEKRVGMNTNIRVIDFAGRQVVERTFKLKGEPFYYLDIVVGNVSHNIAFGAPSATYKRLKNVALASMTSYTPLNVEVSDEMAIQFTAAKIERLWDLGERLIAKELLASALAESPSDPLLRSLDERMD